MFDKNYLKGLSLAFLLFPLVLAGQSTKIAQPAARPTTPAPSRWLFAAGWGGSIPIGNTTSYVHPGYGAIGGVGYGVTPRFSVWLNVGATVHGMTEPVLQQEQQVIGDFVFTTFSVDPTYTFRGTGQFAPYVSGGGGYSIKAALFSQPSSPYHYTFGDKSLVRSSASSLQPMYDAGAGFNYYLHPEGRVAMFVEMRYQELFTPNGQMPGFYVTPTAQDPLPSSNHTSLIPLSLGVRW